MSKQISQFLYDTHSLFADIEFPKKESILHEETSKENINEVSPFFIHTNWQSIDSCFLERNIDSVAFFSAKAFLFFTPAFLTKGIENFELGDSALLSSFVTALDPYVIDFETMTEHLSDYALSRYSEFDPKQKKHISSLLVALATHPEFEFEKKSALRANQAYWALE